MVDVLKQSDTLCRGPCKHANFGIQYSNPDCKHPLTDSEGIPTSCRPWIDNPVQQPCSVLPPRIEQSKPIHIRVCKAYNHQQEPQLKAPRTIDVPSGDDWINTSMLRQAAQVAIAHAGAAVSSAASIVYGLKQGDQVPHVMAVSPEDAERMAFNPCREDCCSVSSACSPTISNLVKVKCATLLTVAPEANKSQVQSGASGNVASSAVPSDQDHVKGTSKHELILSSCQKGNDFSEDVQEENLLCPLEASQRCEGTIIAAALQAQAQSFACRHAMWCWHRCASWFVAHMWHSERGEAGMTFQLTLHLCFIFMVEYLFSNYITCVVLLQGENLQIAGTNWQQLQPSMQVHRGCLVLNIPG
jgi:hypothetical protein